MSWWKTITDLKWTDGTWPLLVVATIGLGLLPAVVESGTASAATGSNSSWSVTAIAPASPVATPDGNVLAVADGGSGDAPTSPAIQELTPSGATVWQLPPTATPQPYPAAESKAAVQDTSGNTYVPVHSCQIESFDKHGRSRWLSSLLPGGTCNDVNALALGWNGMLYVGQSLAASGPGVVALNESTGAIQDFGSGQIPALVAGVYPYPGGIAVLIAPSTVDYYTYSGTLVSSFGGGTAITQGGYSSTSAGNGTVLVGGYSFVNGTVGICLPSVEGITPAGLQWTWTGGPSPCGQSAVSPTPDGGVIFSSLNSQGGSYSSISAQHLARWTYSPFVVNGTVSTTGVAVVDVNGTVAIPFDFQDSSGPGVEITLMNEAIADPLLPPIVIQEALCTPGDQGPTATLANEAAVDVGLGKIYVGLYQSCSSIAADVVQAVPDNGIAQDYNLSLNVPGYAAPALGPTYVSLGDSYSSGEGSPPYYSNSDGCDKSVTGWPEILAHDVGLFPEAFLACSGATTSDLYSSYKGQSQWADLSALPKPSLVTITIGGDDLGFVPILTDCFISDCVLDFVLHVATEQLPALGNRLSLVYRDIETASHGSKVLVVGYPQLFPRSSNKATLHCPWLSPDEDKGLRTLAGKLNSTLKRAAHIAGVDYVSTLNAFKGHELCTGSPWVNTITLSGEERGHPSPLGQVALAGAVLKYVQRHKFESARVS